MDDCEDFQPSPEVVAMFERRTRRGSKVDSKRARALWRNVVKPLAHEMVGGHNPADSDMLHSMVDELGRWVEINARATRRKNQRPVR